MKKDLLGHRFGRLIVIRENGSVRRNGAIVGVCWECQCECGNIVTVAADSLQRGNTQSCGCLRLERLKAKTTVHGQSGTPEYYSWGGMIQRCTNPNNPQYSNYGGRGIKVCKRWLKFENFFKDMGKRPDGLTLERKDTNGNYDLPNCKWATLTEQNRNQRVKKNNKTGIIGVHWSKKLKKYAAQIKTPYGIIPLGYFEVLVDAAEARKQAEIRYWGGVKEYQYDRRKMVTRTNSS